ncbi:DUF924 family protein [Minwuia sp.]|uniref:DUF924 family protein n=1 Tax=Minwuia sp. TaxID=2493630 RepID=UPI003A95B2F4
MEDPEIARVLSFWFEELSGEDYWQQSDAVDARIVAVFSDLYEKAAGGNCDHWQETPEGALALVIVLDQFPRNMFRKDPRAWATDGKALKVAQDAIAKGLDLQIPKDRCMFLYMPFEHSEDIEIQKQSLEIFKRLDLPEDTYGFVVRHHEIIERFGRFPHRNAVLGRETTPEEEAFLKEPHSSF